MHLRTFLKAESLREDSHMALQMHFRERARTAISTLGIVFQVATHMHHFDVNMHSQSSFKKHERKTEKRFDYPFQPHLVNYNFKTLLPFSNTTKVTSIPNPYLLCRKADCFYFKEYLV